MQGWMLSCGGEEEFVVMSIDRMAATTNDVVDDVALMAARAGIGRHDENDGGNVII